MTYTHGLLLEAYDATSHARWRRGLIHATKDQIHWQNVSLPGRHFDWRMRGHALFWGVHPPEPLTQQPDVLLATSFVDLAALRGMLPHLGQLPTMVYFHENQFAYPTQKPNPNLIHHQITSIYNATLADTIAFNSSYNRDTFLDGAQQLLQSLPDFTPKWSAMALAQKSVILPVPLEDHLWTIEYPTPSTGPIRLLWNHRWEYDKAPERCFQTLMALSQHNVPFELIVVGQRFRKAPKIFEHAKAALAKHIVQWGYVENRQRYLTLLASADIVLSTALHDFQGLALQEAMALGVKPLVPDRLAYTHYVDPQDRYASWPDDPEKEQHAMLKALLALMKNTSWRHERTQRQQATTSWAWAHWASHYIETLYQTKDKQ